MHCIGDECVTPRIAAAPSNARAPLMRSVAVGAICAGLGYFVAARDPASPDLTLATIAPPLVLVSEIGE
ncbi:hypothetical protein N4R57_19640 [Rhodobacteraceae bacterium D3-12]|nr:hypothetical protein N4R57_19640 [Rhodobacteraceae bacterium D3-12]